MGDGKCELLLSVKKFSRSELCSANNEFLQRGLQLAHQNPEILIWRKRVKETKRICKIKTSVATRRESALATIVQEADSILEWEHGNVSLLCLCTMSAVPRYTNNGILSSRHRLKKAPMVPTVFLEEHHKPLHEKFGRKSFNQISNSGRSPTSDE
jgi:predicted acetyltransferase